MRAALRRKEWQEQRWRFALGVIVLSGLLGGMLRAQLIPYNEATLMIYWPVGLIMAIFLAIGPVPTERADRTWEFLVARPVSRADILLAKWLVGWLQLVAMIVIATAVGLAAMWSRGFYSRTTVWEGEWVVDDAAGVIAWMAEHPAGWVLLLAVVAIVTLSCWYTILFAILTRARNEFTAAMGGILLTIAGHAWLGHMAFEELRPTGVFCPLSPFIVAIYPVYGRWLPLLLAVHAVLWIVVPLAVMRRRARRAVVA
jgi:ABC-type Na+ efflux pump permease subunit